MSEAEIITRILSGEDALFARIVNRYSGYVWALCSTYIRNPTDREDVAQEIFVQCYRRLDTLRNPAAFGAWLSQLARRHCLMWLRTAGRREKHLARYENHMDGAEQTSHTIAGGPERDELHQGIRAAIDTLPDDSREALLLRYAEGYSVEDAASFLGITSAAMRKRIERAQRMLKDRLWDQVEPALAQRKHTEELAGGILAAIPFGNAPWLGGTAAAVSTSATAGSKLALLGGIAVMSKKTIVVVVALLVMFGLTYVLVDKLASRPERSTPSRPIADALPKEMKDKLQALARPPRPSDEVRPVLVEKTEQDATDSAPSEENVSAAPTSISGKVTDQAGQPLTGAVVTLTVGATLAANDGVEETRSATAGADGTYRIDAITKAGDAKLTASAKGYAPVETGAKWFVSGAPNLTKITSGVAYTSIDFRLLPMAARLAGRVLDKSRAPIPGAKIVVAKQLGENSSQGWYSGASDADGRFDIALPGDGECTLNVYKHGYGAGHFPGIAAGADSLELVLEGGGVIAGRASDRSGKPLKDKHVLIIGEKAAGVHGEEWESPGTMTVSTNENGEYRQDDLSPSFTYTVRLSFPIGEEPAYPEGAHSLGEFMVKMEQRVHSIEQFRFGITGEEVLAEKTNVAVRPGEVTQVDLVTLFEKLLPATVYGNVTDSTTRRPVCPLMIYALSDEHDPAKPLLAAAVTNPNGAYSLSIGGLDRSVRVVLRTSYCSETNVQSGTFVDYLNDQLEVASFDLGPGTQREVNFEIPASITAPMRVVDANGAPVTGVEVCELAPDADGRLTIYGLPPYTTHVLKVLDASGPGYVPRGQSAPFSGKPGETLPEMQIVCDVAFGQITGRIVLPEGFSEYPDERIGCKVYYPDFGGLHQLATITPQGSFTIPNVSAGRCSVFLYVMTFEPEFQYWAFVENVDVRPRQTTDIGPVVPVAPAPPSSPEYKGAR